MKNKNFLLMSLSILSLVFCLAFASATITLTPSLTVLSQTSGSFNLNVSSNLNETINLSVASLSDGSGKNIVFTLNPSQVILNNVSNSSKIVIVSYVVDSGFNFEFQKTYNVVLSSVGSVSGTTTKTIPFESSDFCENGNLGDLNVDIRDVTVLEGFGDNNEWFVFDEIEVEVLVENDGNEDVDNIVVEWGLYNTQSKKWTIELDEESDFNLKDGDEETITFRFTINDNLDEDLQDLDEGDYIIYVRATGEISGGTNDGDDTCSSNSETNNLILDNNFVILSNLEVPEFVQCDSEVQVLGEVWNIGSGDQNDVYVIVYNKELGINERVDIGDIDSFDSSDFNFNVQMPSGIQEKKYYLLLSVYDEDDDIYENDNNDQSMFSVELNVQGSCSSSEALVTAFLESGGEAGKQLVVKATIKNTGDRTATYLLNAVNYTGWASSVNLDKSSLTLDAGESENVLLTFDVKKEALGTNLFNLDVLSENKIIVSQPVQVDITKRRFGITGNVFSGDNKYIWGIGILNLILIVLIIVIAFRIARKR